jgi:glycosyltransferase involved in cell wall biosynthesis
MEGRKGTVRTPADASGTGSVTEGPLRVAQVAPLYEAVPPALYGGTERVVSWLTEELVRRGHRVSLYASGDSRTAAHLVPATPRAVRGIRDVDPIFAHLMELGIVQDQAADFDVIHSHADVLGLIALRRVSTTPVLTTLHGRLDLPSLAPLLTQLRDMPLVSISDAQRHPAPRAGWIGTVRHGLPLTKYVMGQGRGDYAVFLGRISPEKRPDAAIEIARRAGVRLVIAAKVDDVDRDYFEQKIEPLLRGPGVEFIGEVDEREKIALLGEARALLFPILWPEPFGLAMIEAMACGTPVLTRRCGSTAEIVDDPRVGVVCDDDEDLVRALERVDDFDRAACRSIAERRFSVERMADGYESIYRRLCGRAPAPSECSRVPAVRAST